MSSEPCEKLHSHGSQCWETTTIWSMWCYTYNTPRPLSDYVGWRTNERTQPSVTRHKWRWHKQRFWPLYSEHEEEWVGTSVADNGKEGNKSGRRRECSRKTRGAAAGVTDHKANQPLLIFLAWRAVTAQRAFSGWRQWITGKLYMGREQRRYKP